MLHERTGRRSLDEYALIGHYDHWRADLALSRDLGVAAVRWGVPWHRVEPVRGRFDWTWTDQVIPYIVEELGVIPIIDLVHYGCPAWLPKSFDDEEYPQAVSAYARAFAQRYCPLVHWYTPLNEPHMTALMCGRRGLWPPYLRGDNGYLRVMMQVTRGVVATVEALKEVDPAAVIVHVEATALYRSAHEDLRPLAAEEQERRFLHYDLVTGAVTPDHSLYPWLLRGGARPHHLREIAAHPVPGDILGLNFYPQWSTHQLYINRRGRVAQRNVEFEGEGFAELIELFHRRYRLPVAITETSAYGGDPTQRSWLDSSLAAIRRLRAAGVPVVGYTWFPLFTMVDWRYRYGADEPERYHIDLGLYTLNPEPASGPRWRPRALAAHYRNCIARSPDTVGVLPADADRSIG